MATKVRSYRKGDYVYTESAPGSNRFQNFGAAKPTVKKVRDDSRKDKAEVVVKKTTPKATTKPGESKMATAEATRKLRGKEKRFPSAEDRKVEAVGQSQRYRPAPVVSGPRRGGAKLGTPMTRTRGQEQRYRPAPTARVMEDSAARGKRGVGMSILRYFGYPMGTRTIK